MREFREPIICMITDGTAVTQDPATSNKKAAQLASASVEAGFSIFQVREKGIDGRPLLDLVKAAVAARGASPLLITVSGRFDVALAAGADGVHLASDGLTADMVRRHVPDGFLIGVSTHSADEIREARDQGADYVHFGPVFATTGKGRALGIERFAEVCNEFSGFPIIGLGGIDATNYRKVLDAGCSGVAAIRWFGSPIEIAAAGREFKMYAK
jgi:thiamine-phosphate pyrophosphorylase